MALITPALKDKLLAYILSEDSANIQLTFDEYDEELGMSDETISMILRHFYELGLLSKLTFFSNPTGALMRVTVKAHDLWAHGGFTVQEEILKANIEKLDLQLQYLAKQLGPDYLETANKLSSIGNAILSALTLFK